MYRCFEANLEGLEISGCQDEQILQFTPLKSNMSPENRWLEDVFPTGMVTF